MAEDASSHAMTVSPLAALGIDTPPRAPHFIVTLYGDVVAPRGGALWMGSLITACAAHGLSESLVRTAVSRLVSAGRLEGVRQGRRSYYRLTDTAQAEFRAASRLLFDPPPAPEQWQIALLGAEHDPNPPWVRIGTGAALAPSTAAAIPGAVILSGTPQAGDMKPLAARHWPLAEVAQAYRSVIDRFAALPETPAPSDALALRLRLVDDYRSAALADPRLPRDALPEDWPEPEARALFARLYRHLSPAADRQITALFETQAGPLPATTAETKARFDGLAPL
ncbi:phenylacetic acid degradation operon negative regulatory protein [Sagittula marina]|uniref:Phenylacetic acid degradation operon negative regulatory protein n=2 Tax=Sagittula marina TaxID=943940 RepID=A0A7W6DWE1_9RHOB|nr:phenylacetic acid degradation operon negative regulatory protein [Sagittula marina]